jgi:ribonuclease Z
VVRVDRKGSHLEVLFLGSGNAFCAEGSSFNSFLLNDRYLFDAGPTVLPQLRRVKRDPGAIDVIFISHFHADHFFGLPFLLLDFWRSERTRELTIVGPPGIEERTEGLLEAGFPGLPRRPGGYRRRYVEAGDLLEAEAAGIEFAAAEVEHVPALRCFGYRAHLGGRSLMYSGDARLCPGVERLAAGADVLILDCSNGGDPVHMSQADVEHVRRLAPEGAVTIVSHLDGTPPPVVLRDVLIASDLARFRV